MEGLNRFDRGLQEVSTTSRTANLQKLMERETENIRQWKVETERRMEEQQRDIQGKANIIGRLQKQLNATKLEKEEALSSLKENDAKCDVIVDRLEKLATKYQRILKGVAQREKEEQWMKEQHESLMEEKARLKAKLEEAAQRFVEIQVRIDELKAENEDRLARARDEARKREDKIAEISAELAATKESQLLAIEKVSFLEQEMSRKSTSLADLAKEKDHLVSTHATEKDRLQTRIQEAEKTILSLERDLTDRAKELADSRAASEREISSLNDAREDETRRWSERVDFVEKETAKLEDKCRMTEERIEELTADVDRVVGEKNLVDEELAVLKTTHENVSEEKRALAEDLGRCRDELTAKMAALDLKGEEIRHLEEAAERRDEEAANLSARLEEEGEKSATLEGRLRETDDRVLVLESKIQAYQSDVKKYQSEILFQHETLQQREAEYNNLSRKYKEIMEEKEGLEGELGELKETLEVEREAHGMAEIEKEAASREAASLGADLDKAKEQIEMSKQALDKAFADKSTFESDCVQAKMSNTSLQRQLEASETKLKAVQEAEKKLKVDAENWKEERERLSSAATNAEAKCKAEAEKNVVENRSEKEKYDKVIDDIAAKHEEARKRVLDLENKLLDARKDAEEQTKQHEKAMEDSDKDKADLRKYQKDNVDRLHNLVKAAELRLKAKTDELADRNEELASMSKKIDDLEANLEKAEAVSKDVAAYGRRGDVENRKRVAELEAEVKEWENRQNEQIEHLEKTARVEKDRLLEEKEKAESQWEKKMEELRREITDLKLNLDVKEKECQGLTERVQSLTSREEEEQAKKTRSIQDAVSALDPSSHSLAVDPTPDNVSSTDSRKSVSQQPTPSMPGPSSRTPASTPSSQTIPAPTGDKARTPGRTPRKLSDKSWGPVTPGTPSISGKTTVPTTPASSSVPFANCTPSKSTVPPPVANSPFIKKRSMSSLSMNVVSKKSKVTFGGATSRIISDTESPSADDGSSVGADKFLSQMNPSTTPKTAESGPIKSAASAAQAVSESAPIDTEKDVATKSAAASMPAPTASASSSSMSSASASTNPTMKLPKKMAELRAKNEAIREAKRRQREENKAKYGNKFNELKMKNEERALKKKKEMEKKKARDQEDDSSDGCDWF